MKKAIVILLLLFCGIILLAQEKEKVSSTTEQQLENLAEADDAETEDDSYLQQLGYFKKHPVNMNEADIDELAELKILTDLQVQNFLGYRRLLGKLINIYELQAIPGWDLVTIQKLLPFITVNNNKSLPERLKERWTGGEQSFLIRYARVLEKSKGYNEPGQGNSSYYMGSRDKLLFRYKYNYKNLLQWGLLGDKDAGEPFFRGRQKQGFDFYSFHFFARNMGLIKSIAIGDFTLNLGQGLIQWQSLAFRKSAAVLAVKRQAAVLRPYSSPGEYNFHRGVGITLQKRNWETTLFASYRKISANNVIDTVYNEAAVSSFQTSGYHRTPSENEDRNILGAIAFGGNIKYKADNWQVGVNAIRFNFSKPIQKPDDLYNLFALKGSSLTNASIDYSYTHRNIHLFGEAASDNHFNTAILNGILISLDAKVDAAIVYRNIDRAYQSLNGNAFTENAYPVNENGLYAGVSIRPAYTLRVDAYADIFHFPWIKYRVDAPSAGRDYFVQLTYTPNKQVEIYARYKNELKEINRSPNSLSNTLIDFVPRQDLRLQSGISLGKAINLRNRVELLWYNKNGIAPEEGFLSYADFFYKPGSKNWAANFRLQYFETNGYNSRVYVYENDLPYSFSVPSYYDKGIRYYLNFSWNGAKLVNKTTKNQVARIEACVKWGQVIYPGKASVGSNLDEIPGNSKTEIRFQLILTR